MAGPWLDRGVLDALLEIFPEDRRTVAMETFIGDVERLGEAAAAAVARMDEDGFRSAAHGLGPVLETIGAVKLHVLLNALRALSGEERSRRADDLRSGVAATSAALRERVGLLPASH
jgi:hypothetical protein